jgi:hypothetical protein
MTPDELVGCPDGTSFYYKEDDALFAGIIVKVGRDKWLSYAFSQSGFPDIKTDRNVLANLRDGHLRLMYSAKEGLQH